MKVIAFINSKGGVGKSTIASNIAVESALARHKTLLIDCDPQGSSLAFRALRGKDDIKSIAITTPIIHEDIKNFTGFGTVIIDVGGRDSAVFRSAMMACDLIIMPVLPSQYDIWGANDTIVILRETRAYKDIKARFLLNQLTPNTIIAKEALEALQEYSKDVKMLNTSLYSRVAYKNSVAYGKGVSEYEPEGKASSEIRSLYREIRVLLE